MKNFNDATENRTRDLPPYKAVPQPTAPSQYPRYDCSSVMQWDALSIIHLRIIQFADYP